jgi:hypothetical protein
MVDTISKILSIVLIFLMLVLAPLLISYKIDDAVARREILFEVTQFIDKVRDTQSVTDADLDQFYQNCNSHGLTVDVRVRRLVKTVVIDPHPENDSYTEEVTVEYTINDDPAALYNFNKGDGVQVVVEEIGISPSRSFMYRVLGADSGPLKFTLAGIVG